MFTVTENISACVNRSFSVIMGVWKEPVENRVGPGTGGRLPAALILLSRGLGSEPRRGHRCRWRMGRLGLVEPGWAGFDFVRVDLLEEARGLYKMSSPLLSVPALLNYQVFDEMLWLLRAARAMKKTNLTLNLSTLMHFELHILHLWFIFF